MPNSKIILPGFLSEHFSLQELIISQTAARFGIDNSPSEELINHAKKYLIPGLEKLRELFKYPVKINSGYRSEKLNAAIPGSAAGSQHTKFEAADILVPAYGPPDKVCAAIIKSGIIFDQLIYEFGAWTHISFAAVPRRSIMSKWQGQGYKSGIVDKLGVNLL